MNERRRTLLFSGKFVDFPTKNGVWIETIGHKYCLPDDWDSNDNESVNSIAVVTDECKFRVALEDAPTTMALHYNYYTCWDEIMNAYYTQDKAMTDYDGRGNTDKIITLQPSTSYAAGWCNAYTFHDGVTNGYLPAFGELYVAYQNKEVINDALTKCNGATFVDAYYRPSTFKSTSTGTTTQHWHRFWQINFYDGYIYDSYPTQKYNIRAFAPLE